MAVVLVERSGGVCRIILNRPDKLNALNDAVRAALSAEFEKLADDPDIRVVTIEGAGRAFSAGADLGSAIGTAGPEGSAGAGSAGAGAGSAGASSAGSAGAGAGSAGAGAGSWARRRHAFGAWNRLLDLLEALPQVTVAKLHGYVVGGAALLAVTCDLRIAADDIAISIPELALGIPLTWGGVPRLAREIGLPLTRDLVLTGRRLHHAEALACGFVQRVVPRDELGGAGDALVDTLLATPAGPLAMTRSMLASIGRHATGAAGWADADLLMWSMGEPEGRAAAAAYAAARRRTPGR